MKDVYYFKSVTDIHLLNIIFKKSMATFNLPYRKHVTRCRKCRLYPSDFQRYISKRRL